MDAISSDENGKANIDYDKCVSCGQCLVNCPFGAIADKSQISRLSELYSPVKRSMLQLLLHLLDSLVQKLLPESYVQP